MNTETNLVDPSATTQNPADEQLTELENPQSTDPQKPEGDATQEDRDKTIRKLQRRIDSRTRGLGERDQTIAQLRAELSRVQGTQQRSEPTDPVEPTQQQPRAISEEDMDRRVEERAEQRRFQDTVASNTKAMVTAGKAFEDFSELAAEVAEDLPFIDSRGRPTPFILALYDSGKPELAAEVMVHLARNPEVRDELVGLTERQMARKLALIEASIAKKPETRSKAPKPLDRIGGNSRGDPDPDSNPKAWIEARNKKLKSG